VANEPVAIRADRWLDRHPLVPIGLLALVSLALTIPPALAKPFWHDEIYTILLAGLPSAGAIWRACLDGADLSPPLNLWLTQGVHAIAGVGPLTTRLPALLGFYACVLLIFKLLVKRTGPTLALAGALMPFLMAALRYSYEARPYGLVMGLSALTLYCWLEGAAGRSRARNLALLALSLAASVWSHYYAVLLFAPIAAGELTRTVRRRRIDGPMTMAILAGAVMSVPLIPLIRASAAARTTFWSRVGPMDAVEAYRFVLHVVLGTWMGFTVAAAALVIVVWRFARPGPPRPRVPVLPAHEAVAVAVAAAIPLLVFVLGLGTGVFVPRYALVGVTGLSVACPVLIAWLNRQDSPAGLVLCAGLLSLIAPRQPWSMPEFTDPVAARPLLLQSLRSPGPTVIPSSLQFLQLWYYTPPDLQPRLRYLADPAEELRRTGADTFDRGYQVLARWRRVPVEPYADFAAQHPTFRLYEAGSGWLLQALADAGAEVGEVGREAGGRLYEVRLAQPPRP
jgi:hypothetical protein